jgi:integrase
MDTPAGAGFDYQGVAFHAFRKACGWLPFAHGKSLEQVQGWLRHSQLTTTMNVSINQVDDGLGSADAWYDILGALQLGEADSEQTPIPSSRST